MKTNPSFPDKLRVSTPNFELTLLSETPLFSRLLAELQLVMRRLKELWPEFKAHPVRVITSDISASAAAIARILSRRQTALGLATSLAIVMSLGLVVVVLDQHTSNRDLEKANDDLVVLTAVHLPAVSTDKSDPGIGAGEKGRVGFESGRGEGSRPDQARSRGGGGGGSHSKLPPSQGRPPIPSDIPAPIPTAAVKLPQTLPVAGIDLDPALWRKLDYSVYGDPRSKSVTPSNGPGEGGGVGTNKGTGIGEGAGPGFGPGRDGNIGGDGKEIGGGKKGGGRDNNPDSDDPNRVFKPPEVSTRPRVISKPEPQYTEEARKTGLTGTVVLRAVFSSTGQVTNIQAVQKLGAGLTEKAMAAARQIRFVPATRNGQPVSMFMQLEYNFNLY